MFKENVYCIIHNKDHWDAVNDAFEKLGYTPLRFFHSRAGYIRTNIDGTLAYGSKDVCDKYYKGYKQVFLNDKNELIMNNNQSKQCVLLTLEDAKKLYNSDNENFKTIALGAFSKEELEEKELPKSWEELEKLAGYWIDQSSNIMFINYHYCAVNRSTFATKCQAKSALAYAQLTQLMKVYNDGWLPDWEDGGEFKYCIERYCNILEQNVHNLTYSPICFKNRELRDEFFYNFQDLLKEYFMID